ncbi:MAG: hypothetical protein RLZZ308_412 [Candidatus Parcubacteria bacterium]|jgi:hypothetical protein
MKKNSIYILVLFIGVALVFAFFDLSHTKETSDTKEEVRGITFTPIGVERVEFGQPSGYSLYQRPRIEGSKTLGAAVFYENTEANKMFFLGGKGIPQEAPTTITLDIYSNEKKVSLQELLKGDTSYPLITETVKRVAIAGKDASYFEWDGLYRGRSVAIDHEGKTYIFSVTAMTQEDTILQAFDAMLATISFH